MLRSVAGIDYEAQRKKIEREYVLWSGLFSGVGLFMSLAILYGWVGRLTFLTEPVSPQWETVPNAALLLSLVCAALGAFTLHRLTRRSELSRFYLGASRFLAYAAIVMSSIFIFEFVVGRSSGIDNFILPMDRERFASMSRPSPELCLCAILVGVGLVLARSGYMSRTRVRVQTTALLMATFIPFTVLVGFYFSSPELIYSALSGGRMLAMSPHCAALLTFMALGTFFVKPETGIMRLFASPQMGGVMARRFLVTGYLITVAVVVMSILLRWSGMANLESTHVVVALAIFLLLSYRVWSTATQLESADYARTILTRRLRTNEQKLAAVLEALPVGVFFTDERGVVDRSNSIWNRIWGLKPDERPDLEEHPQLKKLKIRGPVTDETVEVRTAEGRPKVIAHSLVPLKDERGKIISLIGVDQDVTRRFELERLHSVMAQVGKVLVEPLSLEETLDRSAKLAIPDLADVCVFYLLKDNSKLELAAHATKPGPCKKLEENLLKYQLSPDAKGGVYSVLRSGKPILVENVTLEFIQQLALSPSNRELLTGHLTSYITVPLTVHGRRLGVVVLALSEGEKRYDESWLPLASEFGAAAAMAIETAIIHDRLEREKQTREDLLAIVSHDLRSPLTAITTNAEFLKRSAEAGRLEPDAVQRSAKTLRSVAERMNHLITDLLDSSKIEAGTFAVELARTRVERIFEQAHEVFKNLADGKKISLRFSVDPKLPECYADGERLFQVISNLIGNALKYVPPGGTVILEAIPKDDRWIEIRVQDTGPGINVEMLPHLFDRYWQARRSARSGAGLGLFISKGIVEAHGGRILVKSDPGSGSQFTFTIPVATHENLRIET